MKPLTSEYSDRNKMAAATAAAETVPFLIVGGGIAGVTCAEYLSTLCPEQKVTVVTATDVIKSACNLKQFGHTLEVFDVEEKPLSSLSDRCPNVTVIKGTVKAFNPKEHYVITGAEQRLYYEKLCICSGGRPQIVGESNPRVIGIRDTESAQVLQKRLSQARRVIVIGNGGIALELVYEMSGCEVIWIIRDDAIGSTFLDKGAATFLLPHLEFNSELPHNHMLSIAKRMKYVAVGNSSGSTKETSSGLPLGGAIGPDWNTGFKLLGISQETSKRQVHIEYECEVHNVLSPPAKDRERLETCVPDTSCNITDKHSDWPVHLQLTNGKVYGCDFVISATGVIPNTEPFTSCAGFDVHLDGGIKVDSNMRTNIPDVYAAGDVCSASWEPSLHWFQMRLWSQARQLGAFAAKCMAQGEIPQDFCFELFSHVTQFFGYKVVLLGKFNAQGLGSDYELLLRCTKGKEYVKVVLHEGKICGAVLIGETDLEETFENLILNQMDMSMFRDSLLDPDVDIEDYFD